jgi:hypothetical protein
MLVLTLTLNLALALALALGGPWESFCSATWTPGNMCGRPDRWGRGKD